MIAIFLDDPQRALKCAELFGLENHAVDGPFELYKQELDSRIHIYIVQHNADAAYAAARLAIRRGAEILLPIVSATAASAVARQYDLTLGTILPVGRVWNLEPLHPLIHVLPNSTRNFPLPLEDHRPVKVSSPPGGDAPSCGTYHTPIRNRRLLAELHKRHKIVLLDRQLAGYADAAEETETDFRPAAFLTAFLGKTGLESESPLVLEKRFEEQMAGFASNCEPGKTKTTV